MSVDESEHASVDGRRRALLRLAGASTVAGGLALPSLSAAIAIRESNAEVVNVARFPDPLPPGSVPGRGIEVNGMHYHLGEQGNGDKTVLMLHGMPDTSGVWRYQIPVLVQTGYRVIAPDLLGYGATDKPADPARYAGERLVDDLVELIRLLGLGKFDLVGHDWGGFLSWELALRLPDLVRRHVVVGTGIDSAFAEPTLEALKDVWYMTLNAQDGAAELYAANDGKVFRELLLKTHPDVAEVWSRVKEPAAMRGMLNWDRANPVATFFSAAANGQLPKRRCKVPTLGVWGSEDLFLWEAQMKRSGQSMDAPWRYERIDHGSHWLMLDHAAQFNALMLDWLAQS